MSTNGNLDTGQPHIIAVVDDDKGMRSSMRSLLRSLGYNAETFAKADMLLAEDLSRFRLVISDLQMPGMSGLELQAALSTRTPDLPFLLMTAFPEPSLRQRAIAAGARALLEKPFDIKELVILIAAAVGPPAGRL